MRKRGHGGENENFVRRDLKKRFKGYKKPVRRGDGRADRGNKNFDINNYENDSSDSDTDNRGTSARPAAVIPKSLPDSFGGISSLGLDPLMLSLDAFNYFDGNQKAPAGSFFDAEVQQCKNDSLLVEKPRKSTDENYRNRYLSTQVIRTLSLN